MIDKLLQKQRMIITCGTGGVGKTTLSAALALRASILHGKKTLILTIDPAKRLAQALGLSIKLITPTDLTENIRQTHPISGSFWAAMPHTSLQEFLRSLSIDEKIFENPFFSIYSQEFAGMHEYMALERILHYSQDYDLLIVDTPPSNDALHFFQAPKILEDFFDEKMVQLSFLSLSKALSLLERLAGKDFFHPLLEFINLIISRKDHFRLQLTHVKNLLNAPTTSRIIVTQKPIAGALLNRTLWHLPDPLAIRTDAERVFMMLKHQNTLPILGGLPEMDRDVHTLEDMIHAAMSFYSAHTLE